MKDPARERAFALPRDPDGDCRCACCDALLDLKSWQVAHRLAPLRESRIRHVVTIVCGAEYCKRVMAETLKDLAAEMWIELEQTVRRQLRSE